MASHQEDGPCMMPTLSVNSCPEAVLIKGEALGGLLTESTHNPNLTLTLTLTPPPTPHAMPFFFISVLFQSGPISLQHTHDLRPPPTPTRVYGVYFDSVLT